MNSPKSDPSRTNPEKSTAEASSGFDAAVKRREDDHLNRWPFAREIYGIATTGPKQWSVRIGIYGEWGTGKTSILEFVAAMATNDDQIIVRFNPWEHSSKDSLWRAFVLAVFSKLEATFGTLPEADAARTKAWIGKAKNVVTSVAAAANERVGKAVQSSLELVKEYFTFSQADLASLREIIGDKRIIILIDDLDRTAPELVPEILFALKELMDIPGFSFICAFDPVVVGKVLRRYNPAFGQGLGFLEKIIDYPRWLPPPTPEALVELAIVEAQTFCDYVPVEALRDAVSLLPANPRAVRQFIRLLALLRPQVKRHYDRELNWPIILAANVIKIRHPKLAHPLLRDELFWERIDQTPFLARDGQERAEIEKQIDEHLSKVISDVNDPVPPEQRNELKNALTQLCSQLNRWALRTTSFLTDQMQIAEAPHAVTWKEYDQFLEAWFAAERKETVLDWIGRHAPNVERTSNRVYNEMLEATLVTYAKELREADGAFVQSDKEPHKQRAESLIALLETLIFQVDEFEGEAKRIDAKQIKKLLETIASFSGATSPIQSRLWPRTKQLALQLIARWTGDVGPLMDAVQPYHAYGFTHYEGPSVRALHQELCAALLPMFARQIIRRFREAGFVDHLMQGDAETYNMRSMLFDMNGTLWKDLSAETFAMLDDAKTNRIIQENAYGLLQWFYYQITEQSNSSEAGTTRQLFKNVDVSKSLWSAATASPLGSAAVYRIYRLPEVLKSFDVTVELPSWWTEAAQPFADTLKQQPSANQTPNPSA